MKNLRKIASLILSFFIVQSAAALEPLPRHLLTPDWSHVRSKERQKKQINHDGLRRHFGMDDLADLLPTEFYIGSPGLSSPLGYNLMIFTDDLLEKIIQTPTGHQAALIYTQGWYSQIAGGLGLSNQKALFYYEKYWNDSLFAGNRRAPAVPVASDKYWYLYSDQKMNFDSWTGMMDNTFVPISPADLKPNCPSCDEKFYRIFAHELAQVADAKMDRLSFEEFKMRLRSPYACAAYAATYHPMVRLGFGTWRAFQIEEKIMKELDPRAKSVFNKEFGVKSCSQKLTQMIRMTSKYRKILLTDYVAQKVYKPQGCEMTFNDLNLKDALKILDQENFTAESGHRFSLCQYFSTPEFGPATDHSGTTRGPRPNVGGGTGNTDSTREESLDKLDQDSRKTLIDLLNVVRLNKYNKMTSGEREEILALIGTVNSPPRDRSEKIKQEKPDYLRAL